MGTVKSFNGIFAFLVLQFLLLLLLELTDISLFIGEAFSFAGPIGMAEHLLLVSAILALLWFAWSALMEPVEIYWGTSAKVRMRKWMLPALLAIACMIAATAAVVLVTRRASPAGVESSLVSFALLLVPTAVTALLLVSALRRWQAINSGIAIMRGALERTGPSAGLDRVRVSIDWEDSASSVSVRPNPQGFTFAGLTSRPWHDPKDFAWLPAFVNAVDDLRAEAEAVLLNHETRIEHYHYVGLDGDFWRNFSFVKRHEEVPENLALCPVVAVLLKTIPGYPAFRDAMFSILGPHGFIRPHRDVSNVFLTLHLPLIVPPGGHIEVGGIRREWRYGEPLIFDSSYAHEAENSSTQPRIVLLVDFPHPELTKAECDWIRASKI
ncbi:aspartyl/asparaginyl beta-hydroxylase domain-containing protein [Novosphingobium mathurense]|uniref:Beta-hydroxylase n=1 Tax=Novosphingobium mathurense TaxID=428990 RepID=A0A1U6HMF5_9SPHN|nr:aspartyl/asparaginyl beta-hydroxylase domain-containing protein [Novosphingobium mathurense]SLJ96920.1 beta-hydroxylase [Novosphingobium mathurense]